MFGFDVGRYLADPLYHKWVYQTRMLMEVHRPSRAGLHRTRLAYEEWVRLLTS